VAGARGRRKLEPGKLTPQEARVVKLAASGRSNREIARELWISVNTVETHLQRAYAKLGVKARFQLIAIQRDETKSVIA
jgi:DNA-binding CsgD family transcriptional regulator